MSVFLKIEVWIYNAVIYPKDACGMANSVDLDQSDLDVHCLLRTICLKTENFYGSATSCIVTNSFLAYVEYICRPILSQCSLNELVHIGRKQHCHFNF